MEPIISSVTADVQTLAAQIAAVEPDYRLALVTYRDAPPYCDDTYQAITVQDFTTDLTQFGTALGSLVAEGGCDEPESVLTGAMQGLGLAFRPGATRVEVLVGDAPGHEPDPVTGFTAASVTARAQSESVAIYGIDAGVASPTFAELTGPTGGAIVSADNASNVATAIQQAITAQATAPTATAGAVAARVSHPAKAAAFGGPIGTSIFLSAATSWSPLGRALTYRWDLNSDGVPDITTSQPVVSYVWPSAFSGAITLTVTDSSGQSAVTRVPVTISGVALQAPSRPGRPKLRRTAHGVKVFWRTGNAGGVANAFAVRSSNGGILAYVTASGRKVQSVNLGRARRPPGFRVRVSALNAGGESAMSVPSKRIRR